MTTPKSPPPQDNTKIIQRVIEDEMKTAYVTYAMSVIVGRALPDVRDGLKPVHRRILYAMHDLGMTHNKPFKKCARIVGECFVKDTLVLTERGLVPIQDIQRAEKVYTQTGLKPVSQLYIMPPRPLLKISLEGGLTNIATLSQQFKVLTSDWNIVWKQAKDLQSGDYLITKTAYPQLTSPVSLGEKKLNSNIAYALGQLLSDGWISMDKDHGYHRLSFYSTSQPIIDRLAHIFQQEFLYTSVIENKDYELPSSTGQILLKKAYQIRINNHTINQFFLTHFNLSSVRAETKIIPWQILQSPPEIIFSFFSGLIDGDGSIHCERNVIQYTTVSEKLSHQFLLLSHHLGLPGQIYEQQAKEQQVILGRTCATQKCYNLEWRGVIAQKLAANLNLAEENKSSRAKRLSTSKIKKNHEEIIPFASTKIFTELSSHHLGGGWYANSHGQKFRAGIKYPTGSKIRYSSTLQETPLRLSQIIEWGIQQKLQQIGSELSEFMDQVIEHKLLFFPVKEITPYKEDITYDIQVADEHEFIANGVISHNCLGKYHPHGDIAVYDSLVRMAQDFSLRYPLIHGQGNFGCFTGDTKVALTDGRELSFLELIAEHNQGKKNYTYTLNAQSQVEIAQIKHPRLTKKDQPIMKVILDDGSEIKCTLNHKFMLRDGKYTQAQKLKPNDSLMPLYLRSSSLQDVLKLPLVGYQMVLQPQQQEWEFVHVLADNWNLTHNIYTKNAGKIRHHADFNKLNNNPDNIHRLPWAQHWAIHANHASALHQNPQYVQKIAQGRINFWSNQENKIQASSRLSQRNRQNWQETEYREKMRESLSKTSSQFIQEHPEIKVQSSQRLKKLWSNPQYQQKMSALKSQEMKQRWKENDSQLRRFSSEESTQLWSNPAHRLAISQQAKARWNNHEYKQKMAQQAKSQWENPSYRAKFPKNHFRTMAQTLWKNPEFKESRHQKAKEQWQDENFRERFIRGVQKANTKKIAEHPDYMKQLAVKAARSLTQKWQDPAYKQRIIKNKIARYIHSLLKTHSTITPQIYQQYRSENWIPKLENALPYFASFSDMVEQAKKYNHSIAQIEFLTQAADVYDLTIDGTHNFALAAGVFVHNSIDGDSAASMRYTEAKLHKIAEELLKDIEKNTVSWRDNFDSSLQEPEVLPSAIPNLLINGSSGIAVGMATNIPPHNFGETADAIIAAIDNPAITVDELMAIMPAPDFPTGAEVICSAALKLAYTTGRGKVLIKSICEIKDDQIIVTEIPYQVNKEELILQIAALVHEKTILGIRNINDESDQDGIRIVIDLKKDADAPVTLNQLYQYSRLQTSFGINMLALVDNGPITLPLRQLIHHHITHRKDVIVKRTQYDLAQAQARVHILDGLLIALSHIDDVVAGIKRSTTVDDAKQFLIASYSLSELQAKAILDLKLQKLASLEQEKIRDEHTSLLKDIDYYNSILASEQKVLDLIKQELTELKSHYADKRRSKITYSSENDTDIDMEQLIEEQTVAVTMTNSGYVKRLPIDTYKTQRRGGKGVKAAGMKDEDFVERIYITSTHTYLLFFTNHGQLYWLKVYNIPEATRQAKGKHISNILELQPNETITAIVPIDNFTQGYLFMATKLGTVKKTAVEEFANPRKGGIRAINLDDNDTLVGVQYTSGNNEIILATKYGNANRFKEEDVRSMGRQAGGVRGIKLDDNDEVIGMLAADETKEILTLTELGYGKRTPVSEYRLCNRGGKGVTNIKITDKNGPVKTVMLVAGNEELMLISRSGNGIRVKCTDISVVGRATQGVRIIRLDDNDKLGAAAMVIPEDENGTNGTTSSTDNNNNNNNNNNNEPLNPSSATLPTPPSTETSSSESSTQQP